MVLEEEVVWTQELRQQQQSRVRELFGDDVYFDGNDVVSGRRLDKTIATYYTNVATGELVLVV